MSTFIARNSNVFGFMLLLNRPCDETITVSYIKNELSISKNVAKIVLLTYLGIAYTLNDGYKLA